MQRIAHVLFALVGFAASATVAPAQAKIEIRKLVTLVDRDGRGFTRAPMLITGVRGGGFVLEEVNELPIVIDAKGNFVKRLGGRGGGPGEFVFSADYLQRGLGDTLYAANRERISVFSPDLRYVRSIGPLKTGGLRQLIPIREGFLISASTVDEKRVIRSFHVLNGDGTILRSFGTDSFVPQTMSRGYSVGPVGGDAFWAVKLFDHRLERWTIAGIRTRVIDEQPAWFSSKPPFYSSVRGLREAHGRLWVLTSVPVPNAAEIMKRAIAGMGGEVDARRVPSEQMATTQLEVYDVVTGKLLADLPIASYPVALLDDEHFMVYTLGPNDVAQLEVWEMKLKP